MSNNKDKIIYECVTHSGWLSKEPIRIYNVAVSGDGSGWGRMWVYDGDENTGKLIIHIICPSSNSKQFYFPDGIPVSRGCYVKLGIYVPVAIIGFKYE